MRSQPGAPPDFFLVDPAKYWLALTYAFVTPAGRRIKHSLCVERTDLHNDVPPPGTRLLVCYVNDQLFRVM